MGYMIPFCRTGRFRHNQIEISRFQGNTIANRNCRAPAGRTEPTAQKLHTEEQKSFTEQGVSGPKISIFGHPTFLSNKNGGRNSVFQQHEVCPSFYFYFVLIFFSYIFLFFLFFDRPRVDEIWRCFSDADMTLHGIGRG